MAPPIDPKFGALVRQERHAKGLGQREMAKLIDVSSTYLCKVELGEYAPPSERRVKQIAEILNCDADEFLAD